MSRFRKPVAEISDRAKRYRAHKVHKLRNRCEKCGSTRNLVPDHKDGNESNNRPSNLRTLCKSCNGKEAIRLKRLGRGVRTRQYNPEAKTGAKNLAEYTLAALDHTRGAHDAGGKIIHETPKSRRHLFAREIAATKRQRGTDRRANPGDDAAEKLYKQFHGKNADSVKTFPGDVDYNNHPKLAQLGKAVSCWVGERCELELNESRGVTKVIDLGGTDEPGWCTRIDFDYNPPDFASEPNGRQIYFVGGDQNIDRFLAKLHVDVRKDLIDCGPCLLIEYETEKSFENFEPRIFFHALGEETGEFPGDNGLNPRLIYNRARKKLQLAGGSYIVKPEGIVD